MSLFGLGKDVLGALMCWLDIRTLLVCAQVCKKFHTLVTEDDESRWKPLVPQLPLFCTFPVSKLNYLQVNLEKKANMRRLMKEYKDSRDTPTNISLGPIGSNISHWEAIIQPESGSIYSGGTFFLDIKFPSEYPFRPPRIFFNTKIYHPNIGANGSISLDILYCSWSPALTVGKCLLSILSLLEDPNADDPMVPEIASLYKTNRDKYAT